jgi:uncharacterized oligopeptide transporter (OPT) family protein
MMAMIAQGVMNGDIPFTLVGIGVVIGLMLEFLSLPILPFAIGLYLPLSLSTPVMVGGLVSAFVRKKTSDEGILERGVLYSSGLVAGDACTGVVIALLSLLGWISSDGNAFFGDTLSIGAFALLAVLLGLGVLRPPKFLKG